MKLGPVLAEMAGFERADSPVREHFEEQARVPVGLYFAVEIRVLAVGHYP